VVTDRAPGALSGILDSPSATHGVSADGEWRSWQAITAEGRRLAAGLEPGCYVIDPAHSLAAVTALLAVGLTPGASAILARPAGLPAVPVGGCLYRCRAEWPLEALRPRYGTATSGSTGKPKIAVGWFDTLLAAPALYASAVPEFAAAEFFAACSPIDFAGTFYACLIPALVRQRDLILFPPHDWNALAHGLRERPGLCMATPAAMFAGSVSIASPRRADGLTLVPAAGYLSPTRADRIATALPGARFIMLLGSAEMGFVSVNRDPVGSLHVGKPIVGKPAWLEGTNAAGTGTLWAAGTDVKHGYLWPAAPLARPDGACTSGDLAHLDAAGNIVLDGRADDTQKLNGITIYPKVLERHVLARPGVQDARARVDRSGPLDRLVLTVVGEVAPGDIDAHCADLPHELRPHSVTCHPDDLAAYSARGKL
jgi:non-ribosomal peptide synthetase component F